jgi:DNA-binding transcriptional LysR family regulator
VKIKLHLLRQAHALKAHGSFSRAAAALNLSQPALSQGIKELEAQVGLQLFVRSRSGPELTDFGRVFMQHAEELVSGAADLEREVALAKGLATGELCASLCLRTSGRAAADTDGFTAHGRKTGSYARTRPGGR